MVLFYHTAGIRRGVSNGSFVDGVHISAPVRIPAQSRLAFNHQVQDDKRDGLIVRAESPSPVG